MDRKFITFLINCNVSQWPSMFLAWVLLVYWYQDTKWKNNGYDIVTLLKRPGFYFRGTMQQRRNDF
jgi:hypothetical protein